MNLQASAFNGRARLDNPGGVRGYVSSGVLYFSLGRHSSLSLGGSFARHERTALLNGQERRVFASLGFRLPELWRFTK